MIRLAPVIKEFVKERGGFSLTRQRLKLLHTADLHLGADDGVQLDVPSFSRVVDAAVREDIDVVVIAGDLFDNARLTPSYVRSVMEPLARLSVPVVVLPGNHDCLEPDSVHKKLDIRELGQAVHPLYNTEGENVALDSLGLAVWGKAVVEHDPRNQPLEGYSGRLDGYWQVVVAHGFFAPDRERCDRSSLIRESTLRDISCDYVALGHWHRFADVTSGGPPAFYSDSPSEPRLHAPAVNIVLMDPEAGVSVRRMVL